MKRTLTSCFGLGYMPIAPGSWGSLPPVIIFFLLRNFGVSAEITAVVMGAIAVAFSYFTLAFSDTAISATGKNDPSEVVSDEVAGQSITLVFASFLTGANLFWVAGASFLLFRFFDITKIWPACKLEKLAKGKGILADDIAAGIYAGLAVMMIFLADFENIFASNATAIISLPAGVLLGIVQGLTEFLPVSSSGHLVLLEKLLPGINPDSQQMLLFDLSIHVATVFAILVYYAKSIKNLTVNLFEAGKYGKNPLDIYKKSPSVRIIVLASVTTFVTGLGYFLFKEQLESARKLGLVSAMWVVTATVLLISDGKKKTKMGLREFGIFAAILIGLSQAVSILPGISRSGATICTAILLGLRRKWAIEFSFLIVIPAILGGAVLKLPELLAQISENSMPVSTILAAMMASFLTGIVSLSILIRFSKKRKLKWFAFYCYILAIFSFIYSIIS